MINSEIVFARADMVLSSVKFEAEAVIMKLNRVFMV